jgi:hypothetical protein
MDFCDVDGEGKILEEEEEDERLGNGDGELRTCGEVEGGLNRLSDEEDIS